MPVHEAPLFVGVWERAVDPVKVKVRDCDFSCTDADTDVVALDDEDTDKVAASVKVPEME